MIRHYDTFDGLTGSLTAAAYWSIRAGDVWTRQGGYVDALTAVATDARALHTTSANLNAGAHGQVIVKTVIRANGGIVHAGVSALGDGTPASASTRVRARYKSQPTPRVEILVPGFATYTVLLTAIHAGFIANGTIENTFWLICDYQGLDPSTGKPVYSFRVFLNGDYLAASPPYVLGFWSAGMFKVGLESRREALVPTPSIHFLDFRTEDALVVEHEPAPALAAAVARTPIVPALEDLSAGDTFPLKLKIVAVDVRRFTRKFATDIGWEITHPEYSKARRVISCRWIGSPADADILRDFFRQEVGPWLRFTVTIHALGIGSIVAVFAEKTLEIVTVAPGVRSAAFRLVECT